MNDNELFEQARRRIQKGIKGRSVTNKEVIVEQEKEIQYYRKRIQQLMNVETDTIYIGKYEHYLEVEINNEQYCIGYNDASDSLSINIYLLKLVNEKDKIYIMKDNCFCILNKTRKISHENSLEMKRYR